MTDDELGEIVDNTDKKYVIGKQEYLLLIKKQKEKPYSTLYITDCESNFWLKKIDQLFFKEIKDELSINSCLKKFSEHFIKGLKSKSKIDVKKLEIQVNIELEIGEGLVMNCNFAL